MDCPVCGKTLSFGERVCISCGRDLTLYRKAVGTSNWYYNDGLEKAKVRDLSGAAIALNQSLKFNKRNTDARNLLGLVYYEMGEVAEALSQWVLSKNFQEKDNDADRYMDEIQKNALGLESVNQMIKKYNSALTYARKGSEDLAIMQLEKAVSLNPKSVKSYQLLGLLYMHTDQYEKAYQSLAKAKEIDRMNRQTQSYMEALPPDVVPNEGRSRISKEEKEEKRRRLREQEDGTQVFIGNTYKEERFNFWPYVNLVIGAVIGIAVVYILIVPTVKKEIKDEYEQQFKTYSDQMSGYKLQISDLEKEKADLEDQGAKLQKEIDKLEESGVSEKVYDYFFQALEKYLEGNKQEAAENLVKVDAEALDNAKAKTVYQTIKEDTFADAAEELAEEGRVVYNSGKYEDAEKLLKKSLKLDPDNVKSIYFLGRTYHRIGDADKAREYYNKIIDDYPDSDRVYDATKRLQELGD